MTNADLDSGDTPEASGPSRAAIVAELRLRRNALIGLIVGCVFAAAIYVLFVGIPTATEHAEAYYLGLAFTIALSTAGLVVLVLSVGRAIRLARRAPESGRERGER